MTVFSPIDRIRLVVRDALERKAAPTDEVELEVAFIPIPVAFDCDLDPEHEHHHHPMPGVLIYISVQRLGPEDEWMELTVFEPHPIPDCDDDYLRDWVDETWERMIVSSLEMSLDTES